MAQNLGFQRKSLSLRLEWKTKVPKLLPWSSRFAGRMSFRYATKSPRFWLMGLEWYLGFFPRARPQSYIVSLTPVNDESDTEDNEEPLKTPFEVEVYMIDTAVDSRAPFGWTWSKITNRHRAEIFNWNLLINDTTKWLKLKEVKIVCLFYGVDPLKGEDKTDIETLVENLANLECLSRDFGRLLEGKQLPDVRLNCGGKTFPAHRSVLAARSEVFAAMFRNKMSESESGDVDVKDFHPDVVRQFLQYLYSGKLSAESEDAIPSLFAIADKYAVDSLTNACSRWIAGNLTDGKCVEYLTVADLHDNGPFKQVIVAFICDHPKVMLGEEWAELNKRHPELAFEVHQSFVRSKSGT